MPSSFMTATPLRSNSCWVWCQRLDLKTVTRGMTQQTLCHLVSIIYKKILIYLIITV
jgi:hypothetical protein